MRLLQGLGWVWERYMSPPIRSMEALANLYLKSVKIMASTAYLLIAPTQIRRCGVKGIISVVNE